jgi:hypothetical protein
MDEAALRLNELFWLRGELVCDLVRSKANSWLLEADGAGWYWAGGAGAEVLNWYWWCW